METDWARKRGELRAAVFMRGEYALCIKDGIMGMEVK